MKEKRGVQVVDLYVKLCHSILHQKQEIEMNKEDSEPEAKKKPHERMPECLKEPSWWVKGAPDTEESDVPYNNADK